MRRRRLLAIAVSSAMLAGASACTILDGWSDVQGGGRLASDAGRGKDDSGNVLDATPTDAQVDQRQPPGGPDDVVCGAARCPKGQACCLGTGALSGQLQCATRSACDAMAGQYLACTRASSCTPSAPLCCFTYNAGASCLAGCSAGQEELCDPADRPACTTGTTCDRDIGFESVPVCF